MKDLFESHHLHLLACIQSQKKLIKNKATELFQFYAQYQVVLINTKIPKNISNLFRFNQTNNQTVTLI